MVVGRAKAYFGTANKVDFMLSLPKVVLVTQSSAKNYHFIDQNLDFNLNNLENSLIYPLNRIIKIAILPFQMHFHTNHFNLKVMLFLKFTVFENKDTMWFS